MQEENGFGKGKPELAMTGDLKLWYLSTAIGL
jgi:hypothetical protein